MNEEIKFLTFADSIGEGASRSRGVISYILIATFITALALFNSLKPSQNWLSSRVKTLQCASNWAYFYEDDDVLNKDNDSLIINGKKIINQFSFNKFYDIFCGRLNYGFLDSVITFPNYIGLSFPKYCINSDTTIDFDIIIPRAARICA